MNGRVLLVEDDENDVFFMQRAWKKSGIYFPLKVVSDGQAAIDYLKAIFCGDREDSPVPLLVLLDLKLPRVMGLEVLKWIRHQPELKEMTVVIFSSSKIQSDVNEAYRSGANSYIVKPGTSEKLLEITEFIKCCWLDVNQSPVNHSSPFIRPEAVLEMAEAQQLVCSRPGES